LLIGADFNGSVDFRLELLLFNCDDNDRLLDNRVDLSALHVDEGLDEGFVTSDVMMAGVEFDIDDDNDDVVVVVLLPIVVFDDDEDDEEEDGGDGQSLPILEHV